MALDMKLGAPAIPGVDKKDNYFSNKFKEPELPAVNTKRYNQVEKEENLSNEISRQSLKTTEKGNMILSKINFQCIIIFTFIFSLSLFGQTKSQLNRKTFETRMDSLTSMKNSLNMFINNLKTQVDSLKNISGNLDKKLEACNTALRSEKQKLFVKKYGNEIGNRVASGQVWKGMTQEMLKDGWGKPDKTHKIVHPWGVFSQWYYGDITYFFKNGKLTDWEEKKKNNSDNHLFIF